MKFGFDNSYARLPDRFYARVSPAAASKPELVRVNEQLAKELRLDPSALANEKAIFAGAQVPEDADPIALAYAGHQFGSFVPRLGDGRAILLGEVVDVNGQRRDVQLKGSGRTPFSRGGDGRAALGPVLREYVVSEAMFAYGIPTTRALAAATTGERVVRDEVLPGAVLTRVAASHVRVGTFEYFAARSDTDAIRTLTKYAIERHYPAVENALGLLDAVMDRQARLIAKWMGVGFIHGVMNTDNTSIAGETIDYGPCAFLDEYNPRKKFSSIDQMGRYAFANQPRIALWNLARFAETLLPLFSENEEESVKLATEHLDRFPDMFEGFYREVMLRKIGIAPDAAQNESDDALVNDLLERMEASAVDYTLFFRKLCACASDAEQCAVADLFDNPGAFHDWAERWRKRLSNPNDMLRANPKYIPRNHRIEEAIVAGIGGNFEPFEALNRALSKPFDEQPEFEHLAEPPRPEERVCATFCGT